MKNCDEKRERDFGRKNSFIFGVFSDIFFRVLNNGFIVIVVIDVER